MKSAVAAIGFSMASAASDPDYQSMWAQYKQDYSKSYTTDEETHRFNVFSDNVDKIFRENAKGYSHKLGVTEFADLTIEEFGGFYYGYNPGLGRPELEAVPWTPPNLRAPDSIDWVAKGAVTEVKNQGQCGSCWAFSTTGSIEGAYQTATGELLSLSEEDLVECDKTEENACKGGMMDSAYTWVKTNGISLEKDYPYSLGKGSCKQQRHPAVMVSSYVSVPANDENAMKLALAKQPASAAIEADKSVFQLYTGGVLKKPGCGVQLDHGILIVGYGTDNGDDYWKIKNSWGPSWGEKGYIRLLRGSNYCGIASHVVYPTGAKKFEGPVPPSPFFEFNEENSVVV